MQINKPVEKKRQVVSHKALPTRLSGLNMTLLYVLYSQVFRLPLWADVVAGICLVIIVIGQAVYFGQEQQVNPFE
jgi:hypothetical protein